MELNKKNIRIIMGLILFTAFVFYGINHLIQLRDLFNYVVKLILPFILGFAIAFILNVPMMAIENKLTLIETKLPLLKKRKRGISLLLTYIFFITIIFLVLFLVIPELIRTINVFVDNGQGMLSAIKETLTTIYQDYPEIVETIDSININWDDLINSMRNTLSNSLGSVVNSTIGIVSSTISFVVELILGFVFSVYLLLQKEKMYIMVKKLIYAYLKPHIADKVIETLQLANKAFSNFLTGQCLEAFILGCMFLVSMTIFKFPYPLTISVFIGCTALVPIFGAFLGCILGIILICATSFQQALWFIVLFLVLQQIEENLVYPRVVGESMGLPSILVLIAVTLGGNMFGVIGMIIFIPLFSILYTLLSKDVRKRLKEKNIMV